MVDLLNFIETPHYDNRINNIEIHSYNPYVSSSLNHNDEIRIPIQQQDLVVLPSESFLFIEGDVYAIAANNATIDENKLFLDSNGVAFLFNEIRYELNGVEVDRCKNVGITTTLRNYALLSSHESTTLKSASFDINSKNPIKNFQYFSFCIPLNKLMGFFDDYKRVIVNARHELILIRSRNDSNAVYCTMDNINVKVDLVLSKIQWKIPHITLEEYTKLQFLNIIEKDHPITMTYRSWELYEYPVLLKTQNHSWSVKVSTKLEKPRFIVFAFQTNRKDNVKKSMAKFDHCNLRNLKLYLNSASYPYDKLNLSFANNNYAILYDMYYKFINSYYNTESKYIMPMLNFENFIDYGPFVAIDCSHQNGSIKSGTVDIKIEFECDSNIPENTSAYCLIIHDQIIEYKPLSGIVRKLI
ncbi:uncharacterized protein [Prorops nasuta]|uniref:uncharacterized protein n=1 Tax=Prorops nasuta TaxID=863751 RepID=UPI0034CF7367